LIVSQKIVKYLVQGNLVQFEPCCSMQTDGRTEIQTYTMKLIIVCFSFENAPKII